MTKARPLMILLIAALMAPVLALDRVEAWSLFSKRDDIRFGADAAAQLEAELPVNDDPGLNRRLNEIGYRLARVEAQQFFQFRFRIVDDPEFNAFALPGGFIYINRGVFDRVGDDDSMLAAIMAHEMGHVIERHGMRRLERALGGSLLLSLLLGRSGDMAQLAGGIVLETILNGYSQDNELSADRYAVQLSYLSGYEMDSARRMLELLYEEYGDSNLPRFLSTHPRTSLRVDKAREFEDFLLNELYRDNPPQRLEW